MITLTTQTILDGRLTRHLVPADSTDLADLLDEELSRGSRHGIYLRALAAAKALNLRASAPTDQTEPNECQAD